MTYHGAESTHENFKLAMFEGGRIVDIAAQAHGVLSRVPGVDLPEMVNRIFDQDIALRGWQNFIHQRGPKKQFTKATESSKYQPYP